MSDINQIIVGSILGDGSLSPLTKRNKCSTLDISQHESKLPYLRWLYDQLKKKFELNQIYQKKGFENQFRFRSSLIRFWEFLEKSFTTMLVVARLFLLI